jgi:drug/metabolite transporter (DMT)-like permease
MSTKSLSPLVVLCLLATWFIWGSTYLAIKFALVSFPPFFQMGTRFLTAGVCLMIWMKFRGAAWPSAVQWRNALIVGALMLGLGMGGTASAEVSVASGLVVAFIAVQPMVQALMLLAWKQYPSKWEWAGISVGLLGVIGLVQGQGFAASVSGLIAICVAIIAWAFGSILSQRVTPLAPGAMGFGSEMFMGGWVLMLLSWVAQEPAMQWPAQPIAVAAWGYLVVFGSLLAFNAYMVLLAKASTGLATSYSFVNPVIALLLGVTWGGEIVTKWEWFCCAVILSGVVLIVLTALRRR